MFRRTDLPSGIRVITQRLPEQRSAAVGAWIACGSRHEPAELSGATHFLEHLLFKGTASRSALRIAQDFDAVGGDLNAFTTKEFTCVHARVLPEDAAMAVDTIGDMLVRARLDPADVESERNVVLEEISMHEDSPDDLVYDVFHRALWDGHALGRPVEGTARTVGEMDRDRIASFLSGYYVPAGIVVSAAGDVEHDRIVDLVGTSFDSPVSAPAPRATQAPPIPGALVAAPREIEQAHVLYGVPGLTRADPRRWSLWVLNTALGGGMSSRLFQTIREDRGLAYNVATGHQGFADTGIFNFYAGCRPDNVLEVLTLARAEIDRAAADGLSEEEFGRARGHVRGSLGMSFDDAGSVMSHLGRSLLLMDEVLTVDEMVARVEAVTIEDVLALAHDVLAGGPWTLAVLGCDERPGFARFVEAT
jgi:predicted Zn-dependent peptidase